MAGSFNIFWCVAMCRNPACPRFLWVSRNWVCSEQHALQPLQDLIHGLCMAHSDILEIKTLVKNESMKQLQHILLGSGERLYAEWLFAQDSHHLSHRISSAISQSLHTCRPIRKHCMYCRNLQESVIIFHISAVPLRGLHCWSILWRPHDKFAAAIIWAMWLSWKLKELEIKGDDEKRWWKSHDLWLGADLCRGTGRRCQFQKKSKDDVHPLGVSA